MRDVSVTPHSASRSVEDWTKIYMERWVKSIELIQFAAEKDIPFSAANVGCKAIMDGAEAGQVYQAILEAPQGTS